MRAFSTIGHTTCRRCWSGTIDLGTRIFGSDYKGLFVKHFSRHITFVEEEFEQPLPPDESLLDAYARLFVENQQMSSDLAFEIRWSDRDEVWIARVKGKELQQTHGETPMQALEQLYLSYVSWSVAEAESNLKKA